MLDDITVHHVSPLNGNTHTSIHIPRSDNGFCKRLVEDIFKMICRRNKDWYNFVLSMEVPNVMHPNLNVFGILMIHSIVNKVNTMIVRKLKGRTMLNML
jgi:hypothetical protein